MSPILATALSLSLPLSLVAGLVIKKTPHGYTENSSSRPSWASLVRPDWDASLGVTSGGRA